MAFSLGALLTFMVDCIVTGVTSETKEKYRIIQVGEDKYDVEKQIEMTSAVFCDIIPWASITSDSSLTKEQAMELYNRKGKKLKPESTVIVSD